MNNELIQLVTIPVEWIRAAKYCDATGEPMEAVESRIREGVWAAGKHYKRTGPRTLWINIKEVTQWVNHQKHVETTPFPKASRSARGAAATASA